MMEKEIVLQPKGLDITFLKHTGIIFIGFFLFMQLFFLNGIEDRILFTLFFILFITISSILYIMNRKSWPQEIRLDQQGISYTDLKKNFSVDYVPWNEIEDMKLFYNWRRVGVFLCISLKRGNFRDSVRKNRKIPMGFGEDINIPVSVNETPENVLSIAKGIMEQQGNR